MFLFYIVFQGFVSEQIINLLTLLYSLSMITLQKNPYLTEKCMMTLMLQLCDASNVTAPQPMILKILDYMWAFMQVQLTWFQFTYVHLLGPNSLLMKTCPVLISPYISVIHSHYCNIYIALNLIVTGQLAHSVGCLTFLK